MKRKIQARLVVIRTAVMLCTGLFVIGATDVDGGAYDVMPLLDHCNIAVQLSVPQNLV